MQTDTPARYCVRLQHAQGTAAYLSHRDRTEWSKRQAHRHAADVRRKQGPAPWDKITAVQVVPA